tara:strand:+ start:510 stop:695 length:186 start_codon:yes stop_codon:yes gene_type:complete
MSDDIMKEYIEAINTLYTTNPPEIAKVMVDLAIPKSIQEEINNEQPNEKNSVNKNIKYRML